VMETRAQGEVVRELRSTAGQLLKEYRTAFELYEEVSRFYECHADGVDDAARKALYDVHFAEFAVKHSHFWVGHLSLELILQKIDAPGFGAPPDKGALLRQLEELCNVRDSYRAYREYHLSAARDLAAEAAYFLWPAASRGP